MGEEQRGENQGESSEAAQNVTSPISIRRKHILGSRFSSVHRRARLAHMGIEFDLAESVLVVDQVLLQDGVQRLGLLRAEIDSLEVADLDARFILLRQGAEDEKEVPDVDAHLHAVGVVLAVIGGIGQLNRWLRNGSVHYDLAASTRRHCSVAKGSASLQTGER